MAFSTKVYVVQKFDRDGNPGHVIGVKLALGPAMRLAKEQAPAKVIPAIGDKDDAPNVDPQARQNFCN